MPALASLAEFGHAIAGVGPGDFAVLGAGGQ